MVSSFGEEADCNMLGVDFDASVEIESGIMEEVVDSILKSSAEIEELFDDKNDVLVCETCSEFGTICPAEGFCVDCQEYLCVTCVGHHRTPRPFKHHLLKNKHDMPRRHPGEYPKRHLQKLCGLHPDKSITSYCQTHDQLCCENCVQIGHIICKGLNNVSLLGASITDNDEFKIFNEKLLRLHKCFTECNSPNPEVLSPMELIDKHHGDALVVFQSMLGAIRAQDIASTTTVTGLLNTVHKQIEIWLSQIDHYIRAKHYGQLFILMKHTQPHLDAMNDSIHKSLRSYEINKYVLTTASRSDGSALGVLKKVPFTVEKVYVKHAIDHFECAISDIVILEEGLILVSDYGSNCSLKLINIKQNTVVSSIKLNSGAWKMTYADNGQVYVTQLSSKKLLCLRSPCADLGNIREIHLREKCCTVNYYNRCLRLQCIDPCKLLELDLEGRATNVINPDISKAVSLYGEKFISQPYTSVMNRDNGSMFVLCYHHSSLSEITADGTVRLVVKSDELKSPSGLSLDSDGSLIVSCKKRKHVLKVTQDGQIQTLVTEKLHIQPTALAFDAEKRKLYIGGSDNYVYIYQL